MHCLKGFVKHLAPILGLKPNTESRWRGQIQPSLLLRKIGC